MQKQGFPVRAKVQIFPVVNPWVYVPVPLEYTEMLTDLMDRGIVPITVTLGENVWNTSLMPKGDGTHFIPLSAKIRKIENIEVGDSIRLTFVPRSR
jgi:hypothetical protein